MHTHSALGKFAIRHGKAIVFIAAALCAAGVYSALTMPSSVFPQTDFPRVVVDVDNGVMPAKEMMATVTRPIEEAMKDIPGVATVRSSTSRGTAQVDVFFRWGTSMPEAELFVQSRISQVRGELPASAQIEIHRLTFSSFPILGFSLTSPTRRLTDLWRMAEYTLKPRFLRVPGVARVTSVGGREPEYHVVADPTRMQALKLGLAQVAEALGKTNLVESTGMNEEGHRLYLTLVNGRVHEPAEIEELAVASQDGHPVRIKDFARVIPGEKPVFNVVTAQGTQAVLLNVFSQPDGSTLKISEALLQEVRSLRKELPPDMKLTSFYDQSLIVRGSVNGVWEAIYFGLILSVLILRLFLHDWRTTAVAVVVIPVTVLVTLLAMKWVGMGFNLMTLGGIAAAIGLVIDDAIVMVEGIHAKVLSHQNHLEAIERAVGELFPPLVGSTLTPVVVFLPAAFLPGVPGVFFRALALTMVVALLTSLVLAVTLTPTLAARFLRPGAAGPESADPDGVSGGRVMRKALTCYEVPVRTALRHPLICLGCCALGLMAGTAVYLRLPSDFLPEMDEGGFLIDYVAVPGTSLSETDRRLREVEKIITATPEVESYSRRTGTAMGFEVMEPNTGDFLIKLKPKRERDTQAVIAELRKKLQAAQPDIEWEFPGILGDLIGDLTVSPQPIEIKLFSPDIEYLKTKAEAVKSAVDGVPGVVDLKNGIVDVGPTLSAKLRSGDAQRFGMTTQDISEALNAAMLGKTASWVLEGDRVVNLRVRMEARHTNRAAVLQHFPLMASTGRAVALSQVADLKEEPGDLELHREDLRQFLAVTGRLEGRDLGSAINDIRAKLSQDHTIPPGLVEYGGLYRQQQESFTGLAIALVLAMVLVFSVLILEFRSFSIAFAILFGAVLALIGNLLALWVTGTSFNIISFLGAIIGVGIVAKNGILLLDAVERLRKEGMPLEEALVQSGRRRLRPVLMTSLAAALGMLPLAFGFGSGADMLRPLGIGVIGALCTSVLLSLLATPVAYSLLSRSRGTVVVHPRT